MFANLTQPSFALPLNLDNGLVLRRSTAEDAEPLAAFNARIHGENEQDARAVATWTRDLLSGQHPTFEVNNFTIVAERATGKIISSMNLISQTWTYAGIPFAVGRPELVGTDPEYRRQGLVRLQFDVIHSWSDQRGEMLQAITGIPYYYRQFGYEMTVNLDSSYSAYPVNVPALKEDETEPYHIRPAQESDLGLIAELYEYGCKRSLLAARWDAAYWRHELLEKSPENVNRNALHVIETPTGEPVGYLSLPFGLWDTSFGLRQFELKPGVSWLKVAPVVMRFVYQYGQNLAQQQGKELQQLNFNLGEKHPAYEALKGRLPRHKQPYAWYVRVPNLPVFLRLIAPVLEERLDSSIFSGYTGDLKLGFYRSSLCLHFEQGHLDSLELADYEWHQADAVFPGLTFLHLLFGHRSVEELQYVLPDCFCHDSKSPLIAALFPKKDSYIHPIS